MHILASPFDSQQMYSISYDFPDFAVNCLFFLLKFLTDRVGLRFQFKVSSRGRWRYNPNRGVLSLFLADGDTIRKITIYLKKLNKWLLLRFVTACDFP